jgi:hypothetical protein
MENKEPIKFWRELYKSVNNWWDYIYLDYWNRRFEITEMVWWDTDYIYDVTMSNDHVSNNFKITRDEPYRTIEWAKRAVESFILEELK